VGEANQTGGHNVKISIQRFVNDLLLEAGGIRVDAHELDISLVYLHSSS
jgi:hypothetical protein